MNTTSMPVSLAVTILNVIPPAVLERGTHMVLQRMRGRFPRLFKNLSQLPTARVLLVPTDTPHQFLLELGCTPITFSVVSGVDYPADARIAGRLDVMIDMLEGRADGDMLFFSRDIQVTGDTSVIVALRNTLDREEINLFAEISGLCGPFAQPARAILTFADRVVRHVKERVEGLHQDMHRHDAQKERFPAA